MSPMLDESLTSWIGSGIRHVNAVRGYEALDFSHAGIYSKNRWNVPGEPTLYLAGDVGVAIAEWGRRFPISFSAETTRPAARDVYRLHLRLGSVLDLRSPSAIPELDHIGSPDAFRNVEVARHAANWVRTTTRAQAMLVPSIAFLDDLTRWNLVEEDDNVPAGTTTWITQVDRLGPLSWDPASG